MISSFWAVFTRYSTFALMAYWNSIDEPTLWSHIQAELNKPGWNFDPDQGFDSKFNAFLSLFLHFDFLLLMQIDLQLSESASEFENWRWVNYLVLAGGRSDCQKSKQMLVAMTKIPKFDIDRRWPGRHWQADRPSKLNNDGKIPASLESDDAILTSTLFRECTNVHQKSYEWRYDVMI